MRVSEGESGGLAARMEFIWEETVETSLRKKVMARETLSAGGGPIYLVFRLTGRAVVVRERARRITHEKDSMIVVLGVPVWEEEKR